MIDAYIKSLGLSSEKLSSAQSILQKHGNMSSATILYVIKDHLQNGHKKEAERGLIGALGRVSHQNCCYSAGKRGPDSCFGC